MFRDTNEELKRLEEELLQEEEEPTEEELLEEAYEELTEDPADYDPDRIYNADRVDEDVEALSEAVLKPRKKSGFGFAICLLLLTAAVLLFLAAWVLRQRG